ncbi:glycosyltransferase [Trichothermofontia sp.]
MLHFLWCGFARCENSYQVYELSNLEIAKWAEYYLGRKTAFHQSNWMSGKITENPHDILLGHPTWDGRTPDVRKLTGDLERNWVKDNALLPGKLSHPNTYILMPWVPEFPPSWTQQMPFWQQQLLAANKIFALCGKIWIDRTETLPQDAFQYRIKDKLVHCNMGIASQNFPIIKQKFNAIGERQILHISNLDSYKGFDITCESIEGLDTLLHVATSSLQAEPGLTEIIIQHHQDGSHKKYMINYLGSIDNHDLEFNHWVVETCDFYIHTGRMDAQATTILENSARGLVPLVTPESGFASPHAIYLTHDPDENRDIIRWALNLPESELLKRSHLIREQIQNEHNWESIYTKIWDSIIADIEVRSRIATDPL